MFPHFMVMQIIVFPDIGQKTFVVDISKDMKRISTPVKSISEPPEIWKLGDKVDI